MMKDIIWKGNVNTKLVMADILDKKPSSNSVAIRNQLKRIMSRTRWDKGSRIIGRHMLKFVKTSPYRFEVEIFDDQGRLVSTSIGLYSPAFLEIS